MAVIHTEKKRFNPVLPLLAFTAVAGAMGVWWFQQSSTPTSVTPIAAASAPAVIPAPVAAPVAQEVPPPQEVAKLVNEQNEAAKEIEAQPQIKPVKGVVSEKPSFMSEMEWGILKAVAQQQPDPDKTLTTLVNKVRFTKQLEVWQDLPSTAGPAKRKLLADELLEDLPQRVLHEDMDMQGAQKLQTELLQDAEPDAKARAKRAAKEAKRLEKATPSPASAG
jgi:hypothetical protein